MRTQKKGAYNRKNCSRKKWLSRNSICPRRPVSLSSVPACSVLNTT